MIFPTFSYDFLYFSVESYIFPIEILYIIRLIGGIIFLIVSIVYLFYIGLTGTPDKSMLDRFGRPEVRKRANGSIDFVMAPVFSLGNSEAARKNIIMNIPDNVGIVKAQTLTSKVAAFINDYKKFVRRKSYGVFVSLKISFSIDHDLALSFCIRLSSVCLLGRPKQVDGHGSNLSQGVGEGVVRWAQEEYVRSQEQFEGWICYE